jgi:hypothetical protein
LFQNPCRALPHAELVSIWVAASIFVVLIVKAESGALIHLQTSPEGFYFMV